MIINNFFKKITRLVICLLLLFHSTLNILAISPAQRLEIERYPFFDPKASECAEGAGAGTLPNSVPAPYNEIFTKAGQKHNVPPALIAAIFYAGEHASHWPDPNGPWASSSAGAQGPFQFLPSTWKGYGNDGDGDGRADIQNLSDGAFGAAKYLGANGGIVNAPEGEPGSQPGEPSIRNAIWHYNHSNKYVERVFNSYKEFSSGSNQQATSDTCKQLGGLGISADGFVFPLKTTKSVIKQGSGFKWCYESQKNCHHDYNAADIAAPTGTPIVASRGGAVVGIGTGPQRVRIKGDDGLWYYYTHMLANSATVKAGDHVEAGQQIGVVGTSADAEGTPSHLHFDVSPEENSFCRGRSASRCPKQLILINPQPVLIESFKNLPE